MEWIIVLSATCLWVGGYGLGRLFEARRWRAKGDHEYMNRMESAGGLYQVKRER